MWGDKTSLAYFERPGKTSRLNNSTQERWRAKFALHQVLWKGEVLASSSFHDHSETQKEKVQYTFVQCTIDFTATSWKALKMAIHKEMEDKAEIVAQW